MRVAVFRARPDGERTARRLEALGHEAVLAPVLHIAPTGARLPATDWDAVVFTSLHGVEAVADDPELGRFRSLPCFCVGARAVAEATRTGFADVRPAQADAGRLCDAITGAMDAPNRLLFITGRDRKPTVENRLTAAGYGVSAIEAYAALAVTAWDDAVVAQIASGTVTAALHYSRRSAELALATAERSGLRAPFLALSHHGLSPNAGAPLREAGAPTVIEADRPDEKTLLATLTR